MNRWKLNLYVVWATQIISIMSFSFGMPFMAYYIQELGVTDPDTVKMYTGILSAAPAITMGLMAPVWGRMSDKIGKKPMLLRAVVAGSIVMLGLGLAGQIWQLMLFRFIQGAFTGTITAAAALVASSVPENKLTYSLGFLSSSTFIGASAGPAMGGLVAEWFGYRTSFMIGSAFLLLDVLLVVLLVQEPSSSANRIPEKNQDNQAVVQTAQDRRAFMKTGWFLLSMFLLLILRIMTNIFLPFLPIHIQATSGLEGAARTTGLFNGFVSVSTALSGLILGQFGDRYNRVKLMQIYGLAGLVLSIPLYWLAGAGIWILMVGYGIMMFFIGGIEPLITSSTSSRIDVSQRGTLFGLQATVSSIGWTIYPALGSMISIQWSIPALLITIPVFILIILFSLNRFGQHLSTR